MPCLRGFFHHIVDAVDTGFYLLAGDDAILVGVLLRYFFDGDDTAAMLLVDFHHLWQYAVMWLFANAQVVGQDHAKG